MMIRVLSIDRQVTLATTALVLNVIIMMNLATLFRTVPTRFLHQEHHITTEDLIQGINTPTTGGTNQTPTTVPDIGDITADHSLTPIHTTTEASTLEAHLMLFFQPQQQLKLSFS